MQRRLLALSAGAVLLLAAPATATAATTIGLDPDHLLPDPTTLTCAAAPDAVAACTLVQDRLAGEPVRVPAFDGTRHGVVTRWRVWAGDGEARLRRLAPDATAPRGASAWAPLPAGGGVAAHAAALPVETGDAIGLDLTAGARVAVHDGGFGGAVHRRWAPGLAEVARIPDAVVEGEIFLQVSIEPDADRDGRGDESHPPAPHLPPLPDPPSPEPPGSVPPPTEPTEPPTPSRPATRRHRPVPRAGPRVAIPRRTTASRRGVAAVELANPYGVRLTGTLAARRGRTRLATARVRIAAGGSAVVRIRLDRAGARGLARGARVRLALTARLAAPTGRARTTRATTVVAPAAPVRRPGRTPSRPPRDGAGGFDGTYRAADGLTLVVEDGLVTSFSGTITTYCTRSSRQKLVSFGMFGDDPAPRVAPDGRFAYEATRGYGMVKLTYRGRIRGSGASGNLAVEDRSPLLGTGRFEFDYCFAGRDWTAAR